MMRIVIVDDESITRQWIRKKIEELSADYSVVGAFSNGVQALEYCRNNKVDVIFTDIRMSLMDGMELLENIQKLERVLYKVILSGYDEFQYARQAIKLGVNEFVLKPEITQEELKRILKDAEDYLASLDNNVNLKITTYRKKEDIIRNIMDNPQELTENELEVILSENKISLENKNLVVICISFENEMNIKKAKEIFELFFEEKCLKGYCFQNDFQEFIIVYNHRTDLIRRNLAEELLEIMQIHLGTKLYVGVSSKKDGFLKLNTLCGQASQAMANRIFFNISGCQLYDEMRVSRENSINELYFNDMIKELAQLLENEKYSEADEKSDELLRNIGSIDFLPPTYVKALCNELLTVYMHRLWRQTLTEDEKKVITEIELLLGENLRTYPELYLKMEKAKFYLSDLLQKKRIKNKYSIQIQEIVNYIDQHYMQRIVMEDIAKEVHLSKTYISALFKKETGEKFSEYLQRIRLERACGLLKTSKFTIGEIAIKTGFSDAAHFSHVFKERYQMSPIEYRKLTLPAEKS